MMELTCAYVLIIVSAVCASPYGYGTKGGAIAKAEASATAGSSAGLSGLPYTVPTGAGFSGSFSKSSSSSFASSSASSSSSSSSFSYSGTGSGAQHGLGANGGTGCGSGGCHVDGSHGNTNNLGSDATGSSKAYSGANAAATNGIAGNFGPDATGNHQGYIGSNAATNNGITGTHGAGASAASQAYSAANAGAIGSVGNLAGSHGSNKYGNAALNTPAGCAGSSCSDIKTSNKCTSGQCGQPEIPTTHINSDAKCTSGQCGQFGTGAAELSLSNSHESNDIPAKLPTSTLSQNTKDQHSNYDKTSTLHESPSGLDCSNGNCDSLGPSNTKPTAPHGSFGHYQIPSSNHQTKCNSPNCNTYDYNANSVAIGNAPAAGYHKPATYLTTPKQGPSCISPECQLKPSLSTEKPSSYNVPIHGSYGQTENKSPCVGGTCDYHGIQTPSTNIFPPNIPTGPSASGSNCASGKCPGHPSSQSKFDFNEPNSQGSLPAYSPIGSTYKLPYAPSSTPCTTSNCAPTGHSGSEAGANNNAQVLNGGSVTHPFTHASHLTPGFGHPSHQATIPGSFNSNCNSPNCAGYSPLNKESQISPSPKPGFASIYPSGGYLASGLNNPSFTSPSLQSYITPTLEVTIPNCGSGGCAKHPSLSTGSLIGSNNQSPIHSQSPHIPVVSGISSLLHKHPSHSSSGLSTHNIPNADGSSLSCNTPNCVGHPSGNSGTDSYTEKEVPVYTGGFGGPSGLLKPNDFSTGSNSASAGAAAGSASGIIGAVKPSTGPTSTDQKRPTYTGGFGAPSGLLKPNEFNTGTVNTNAGAAAGSTSGFGGVTIPSTGASSTHHKQPTYTDGFGGPSGLLKPNELGPSHSSGNADVAVASNAGAAGFAKPSTTQTGYFGSPLQKPHEHNTGGTPTGSGSLSAGFEKPVISSTSFDKNHPAYTTGFGAPSGIQKPDDFSSQHPSAEAGTPSSSHPVSIDTTQPGATASSSDQKLPSYTGGFGGAAGILKPNEFKIPTSNVNKSPTPAPGHNPISCFSGNCGSQPDHLTPVHGHGSGSSDTQATAAAAAKAEAVAYSGGFGGPPGFLKPHDGGKLQHGGLATGGKLFLGSQFDLHHGATGHETTGTDIGTTGVGPTSTGAGVHSPYNSNDKNSDISGSQANAVSKATATAQASAVAQSSATASATAGAFGGSSDTFGKHADIHGKHESGGCGGGCGLNGGDTNLGLSTGLGWSKTGSLDNLSVAGASAKSTAGAVSGARAFGTGGGSFASSSATAHASSGFPTKGGYGR